MLFRLYTVFLNTACWQSTWCFIIKVFWRICYFREFSDKPRGLLIVSTEGEDSLISGVECRSTFTGQWWVVKGEILSLESKTSRQFIIKHSSRSLKKKKLWSKWSIYKNISKYTFLLVDVVTFSSIFCHTWRQRMMTMIVIKIAMMATKHPIRIRVLLSSTLWVGSSPAKYWHKSVKEL